MYCIDGEKGPGNMTVDVQRNRILATTVLKQASSLADNGDSACKKVLFTFRMPIFFIDKLLEAQAELKRVIQILETSLSREQDFCNVD